ATAQRATAAPAEPGGVDDYREIAYAVSAIGSLDFTSLKAGVAPPASVPVPALDGARITSVTAVGKGQYVMGTSDGRVIGLTLAFETTFDNEGRRTVTPRPSFGEPAALDPGKRAILRLSSASPAAGKVTVAQLGPTELMVQ